MTLDASGGLTTTGAATFGGVVKASNLTTSGDSLYFLNDTNATAPSYINFYGYQGGVTQFRNTVIANGKGNSILTLDGATKAATFSGQITANVGAVSGAGIAVNGSSSPKILVTATSGATAIVASDGSASYFGTSSNHPVNFRVNNVDLMTLSASGNLGLGVVPSAWSGTSMGAIDLGALGSISGSTTIGTSLDINAYFNGTSWIYKNSLAAMSYVQNVNGHYWKTAAVGTAGNPITFTQAMTLTASGNLLVGTTATPSATQGGFEIRTDPAGGGSTYLYNSAGTYTGVFDQFSFFNGNGIVGKISTDGSATTYATSSDYRLKEDDVPMTGATERVKALRPINFAWKVDGSRRDGFFAHEAQEVVPECATGSKDAMRDEDYEVTPAVEEVRDEDGNVTTEAVAAVMGTRSVPDYQGIDQSKLVPLLTATIQELIARIEALEGAK